MYFRKRKFYIQSRKKSLLRVKVVWVGVYGDGEGVIYRDILPMGHKAFILFFYKIWTAAPPGLAFNQFMYVTGI